MKFNQVSSWSMIFIGMKPHHCKAIVESHTKFNAFTNWHMNIDLQEFLINILLNNILSNTWMHNQIEFGGVFDHKLWNIDTEFWGDVSCHFGRTVVSLIIFFGPSVEVSWNFIVVANNSIFGVKNKLLHINIIVNRFLHFNDYKLRFRN